MPKRKNKLSKCIANDLSIGRASLANHLCNNSASNTPVKIKTLSERLYPYSAICRVEATASESLVGRYYIKRLLPRADKHTDAERRCIKEAELLSHLNKIMPHETVELTLVIPERFIIITAECPGLSLSHMFRWHSIRKFSRPYQKLLLHYAACCGDWLRRFHATTKSDSRAFDKWTNYLSGEVEWRIKQISAHDPRNISTYVDVARNLQQDIKQLATSNIATTIHSDFSPHNIFVDNKTIQVLDFSDAKKGHGLMDVINFIASIASRCESEHASRRLIEQICITFANAYGGIRNHEIFLFNTLITLQSVKRLLVLHQQQRTLRLSNSLNNGKSWHYAFLANYINKNSKPMTFVNSPWPFIDLQQLTK